MAAVHIGSYRNNNLVGALCGSPGWRTVESKARDATCKRCLQAFARIEAAVVRSNTERSAGRIPRTPGR